MRTITRTQSLFIVLAIVSALAACGGGGGNDKTEENPPPSTQWDQMNWDSGQWA